jgi:hypothetical protein
MGIQRSLDWTRELLPKIADVKAGMLPSWERMGNADHLYSSAEGARLGDVVDPTSVPQRFPLGQLEAAVPTWIAAVG